MRTAHELLDTLAANGVRVSVEPNADDWQQSRLQVTGSSQVLTEALRAELRRLKTTLVAVLLVCDCRDCAQRVQRLRIDNDSIAS